MRTTQFIGHTDIIKDFLSRCKKKEKIGEVLGMFDEHVYDLHRYEDCRGDIWEEEIQAEPWSSGPVIFLGVRCGNYFEGWESQEILNY